MMGRAKVLMNTMCKNININYEEPMDVNRLSVWRFKVMSDGDADGKDEPYSESSHHHHTWTGT